MIVTIFRSRLRPDALDLATPALELARTMPGFLSFKTFQNPDGERCSIIEFADWETHHAWAKHSHHIKAQKSGSDESYQTYSVTVAETVRVYRTWPADKM